MNFDFSIIIPYWNKLYEINLMLKALTLQDYDSARFQVVIVNDGCRDAVAEVISKYRDILNIKYKYIRHTGNRGRNRNYGAKIADSERLIFLDSDMVPSKNMLKAFDDHIGNRSDLVSLGMRYNLMDIDRKFIDENTLENHFELLHNLPAWNDDRTISINFSNRSGIFWNGNWQFMYSHSFCIRKDVYLSVGGFDEEFSRNWGAEDVELGYRLYREKNCKIELNRNVLCYHIFHGVDFLNITASLKKNYAKFVRTHRDWEVELFTREFECWSIQAMTIQDYVKKKKHLVHEFTNVAALEEALPGNCILAGIDIPELVESAKIKKAYVPESRLASDKIENLLGICLDVPDRPYDLAIVSGEYGGVNEALQLFLEDKFSRMAEKILVLKNGGSFTAELPASARSNLISDSRYLIFSLNNDVNHNLTRYNFLCLALAAERLGVSTAIEFAYDPLDELELNEGFLHFSDPTKKEALNRMHSRKYNFIGDMVPCFMENICTATSNRSLGHRIFWEEVVSGNYEKYFSTVKLDTYNILFYKRAWENAILPNPNLERHSLPAGIDREKILRLKGRKRQAESPFVFLWAEQFTSPYSNIEPVLETFREAFGDRADVQLTVILPVNFRRYYHSEFFGQTFHRMAENYINHYLQSLDLIKAACLEKYCACKNIRFVDSNPGIEECSKELAESDCLIAVNSLKEIHPLALESVALGKKPLVPADNRYDGYFGEAESIRVKAEKISALFSFGSLETPKFDDVDKGRYCLISRVDRNSLKEAMLEAVRNRQQNILDEKFCDSFVACFDWDRIAEKMISVLY